MNSLKRFVSDWFGYSRRERRAVIILIILIAVVILVRFLIPEKRLDIEVNSFMPSAPPEEHFSSLPSAVEPVSLFNFDPNTASFADLITLGIPGKVAGTLIRYRNSGARFREPGDIMKVYGMDTVLAKTLIPYIIIEKRDPVVRYQTYIHESPSVIDPPALKMVDINKCDSADLEALPGIGPVLSERIIKYRELLGGYVSSGQLMEVYGLADSVYQIISGMVIIDTSAVRRININSAGFRDIDKHPYVERYEAQSIIKFREVNGKIRNFSELTSNRIISEEKAKKISSYFSF